LIHSLDHALDHGGVVLGSGGPIVAAARVNPMTAANPHGGAGKGEQRSNDSYDGDAILCKNP